MNVIHKEFRYGYSYSSFFFFIFFLMLFPFRLILFIIIPYHPGVSNVDINVKKLNENNEGCGYDIFSDAPRFPVMINVAIFGGGWSLATGLFYASILKAQAETEEDDKKYMSGR